MSEAEELHHAAKLMRERARAATPGPWEAWVMGSEGYLVLRASGTARERGHGRVARVGMKEWEADRADAEHIAGMHPGAALAVADWLEECSRDVEGTTRRSQCDEVRSVSHALTVARAYLGAKEAPCPPK